MSVHIFSCNRLLHLVWCLMFFYLSFFFSACRKVVIVGDSIIKDIRDIDAVTVRPFPSATIGAFASFFEDKKIDLQPSYDYIILHVGTNNIANRDRYDGMISDYANLMVAIVRRCKPDIRIVVSPILPRPVDHSITDKMIKNVNRHLKDE